MSASLLDAGCVIRVAKEAALGFVGIALCVCFISGVFPYMIKEQ